MLPNLYIYGAVIVIGFLAGWNVHGWKTDSETLAAVSAVKATEMVISKQLEDKLKELRANQTVVRHEVTNVIERPVYRNECFDTDGVRLVNLSKSGTTKPAD